MSMNAPDPSPETQRFHLNGVDLTLPLDLLTPGIRAAMAEGHYEADEARAADRCCKPGFRVLELGGGAGYLTTLCAAKAGAENVLTVEANPALIPVLEHNLRQNGQSEVSVLNAAVAANAEEDATAQLNITGGFTGSSLKARNGRLVDVPLVSIQELIAVQRPHVIIIDVEGTEADLFDAPWDCPLRFCVMELHPKKYGARTIKKIVDFMSAMDMTYDPVTSRGKVLGFRKIWDEGEG